MNTSVRTGHGTRAAWTHLAFLTVLVGGITAGASPSWLRLGTALDALFFTLPALVAISVGTLDLRRSAIRQAVVMTAVTTAALVVADTTMPKIQSVETVEAIWTPRSGLVANAKPITMDEVSAIPLLVEHLLHPDGPALTIEDAYTGLSPRLRLCLAVLRMVHIASGLVLVGLIVGLMAWIDDHVTFRRPSDARLARLAMAWVVAPAGLALLTWLGERVMNRSLFVGTSVWEGFVVLVPFSVAGAIGWWAAARRVRYAELTS